jgi:hypothetical protein
MKFNHEISHEKPAQHLANPVCQVDGEMPSEEKLLDAMQRLNGALQAAPFAV